MPSVISPFICGTRNLISQSFRSLPVILGISTVVLGLVQGNINFFFFFVGLSIVAPTAAFLLNVMWELVFSNTPNWLTVPFVLWKLPEASAAECAIFTLDITTPASTMNVVPSYWLTMMLFFYSYIFLNAKTLYERQETSKAPKAAVEARKTQSMISMILVSVFAFLTVLLRYATGCETALGTLVSGVLGYFLASGWYEFMKACGLGRLDDLFGISNRILPYQSTDDAAPTVCVPK